MDFLSPERKVEKIIPKAIFAKPFSRELYVTFMFSPSLTDRYISTFLFAHVMSHRLLNCKALILWVSFFLRQLWVILLVHQPGMTTFKNIL